MVPGYQIARDEHAGSVDLIIRSFRIVHLVVATRLRVNISIYIVTVQFQLSLRV